MRTVGKTFTGDNLLINPDYKINLQKDKYEGDHEDPAAVPSEPDNKQGQRKKNGKGVK